MWRTRDIEVHMRDLVERIGTVSYIDTQETYFLEELENSLNFSRCSNQDIVFFSF